MESFVNKVAIITGSSMGIGKATAYALAEKGVKIMLNGRNEERLEKTMLEMQNKGFEVSAVAGDVTALEDCQKMIHETIEKFGKIDYLINNAGMSSRGTFEELDPEVFQTIMDINFIGSVFPTKHALPYLKETKGSIIFVSSLAGIRGLPGSSVYSASKMAQTALAESLMVELHGTGIHVGIIYVGVTYNEPEKKVISSDGEYISIADRSNRSVQSPDQVAKAIVKTIKKKKFKQVLTGIGKVHALANRFVPSVGTFVLKKAKKRIKKMYK